MSDKNKVEELSDKFVGEPGSLVFLGKDATVTKTYQGQGPDPNLAPAKATKDGRPPPKRPKR